MLSCISPFHFMWTYIISEQALTVPNIYQAQILTQTYPTCAIRSTPQSPSQASGSTSLEPISLELQLQVEELDHQQLQLEELGHQQLHHCHDATATKKSANHHHDSPIALQAWYSATKGCPSDFCRLWVSQPWGYQPNKPTTWPPRIWFGQLGFKGFPPPRQLQTMKSQSNILCLWLVFVEEEAIGPLPILGCSPFLRMQTFQGCLISLVVRTFLSQHSFIKKGIPDKKLCTLLPWLQRGVAGDWKIPL